LNDDANSRSLAAALQREGVEAPLRFLGPKRESGCYGGQPRLSEAAKLTWISSRRFAEQLRGGFRSSVRYAEQPIAVAADKVDLMPSAFSYIVFSP